MEKKNKQNVEEEKNNVRPIIVDLSLLIPNDKYDKICRIDLPRAKIN